MKYVMRLLDGLLHAASVFLIYSHFGTQWALIWLAFGMGCISHRVGQDEPKE
jgi:hypothetical protein